MLAIKILICGEELGSPSSSSQGVVENKSWQIKHILPANANLSTPKSNSQLLTNRN